MNAAGVPVETLLGLEPQIINILQSLVCWDWQNTESLAAVLVELLEFYKEYQLKRAGTNMVLQRHMGSLLEMSPDSLQVVVNKKEVGLFIVKAFSEYNRLFGVVWSLRKTTLDTLELI